MGEPSGVRHADAQHTGPEPAAGPVDRRRHEAIQLRDRLRAEPHLVLTAAAGTRQVHAVVGRCDDRFAVLIEGPDGALHRLQPPPDQLGTALTAVVGVVEHSSGVDRPMTADGPPPDAAGSEDLRAPGGCSPAARSEPDTLREPDTLCEPAVRLDPGDLFALAELVRIGDQDRLAAALADLDLVTVPAWLRSGAWGFAGWITVLHVGTDGLHCGSLVQLSDDGWGELTVRGDGRIQHRRVTSDAVGDRIRQCCAELIGQGG